MINSRKINDIEPFNDLFYRYCFNSSLVPVLKHYNKSCMPILTNEVCFYNHSYKEPSSQFDVEYISAKCFEELIGESGILCNKKASCDNIFEDVITSINNDKPVIVWVDCYYEKIRTDTYLKNHLSHVSRGTEIHEYGNIYK